jgi:hypothetical protein
MILIMNCFKNFYFLLIFNYIYSSTINKPLKSLSDIKTEKQLKDYIQPKETIEMLQNLKKIKKKKLTPAQWAERKKKKILQAAEKKKQDEMIIKFIRQQIKNNIKIAIKTKIIQIKKFFINNKTTVIVFIFFNLLIVVLIYIDYRKDRNEITRILNLS